MLKELAKQAGLTQDVTLYSIKATNKDFYNKKPLWKHISSHCIRRYAVNRNLVKYGLIVAKQYSGHKSYAMIQKHYSRNLSEQELLKAIS
jgi:integrase